MTCHQTYLSGTDNRLSSFIAPSNHHLLCEKHLLRWDFNTQITSGNHDAIRSLKNLIKPEQISTHYFIEQAFIANVKDIVETNSISKAMHSCTHRQQKQNLNWKVTHPDQSLVHITVFFKSTKTFHINSLWLCGYHFGKISFVSILMAWHWAILHQGY